MTSSSARAGSLTARAPSSRASVGGALGRAVPHRHLARAGLAQRPDRRARAAAGTQDERARPGGETGELLRAPRSDRARRCSPPRSSRLAENVSVFAAPIARAASLARSASASAACLWGIVTFAPTKPACSQRARGLREQLLRHRQRLIAPVAPSRAPAARRCASPASGCAPPASRALLDDAAPSRHYFFLHTGGLPPFFLTAAS